MNRKAISIILALVVIGGGVGFAYTNFSKLSSENIVSNVNERNKIVESKDKEELVSNENEKASNAQGTEVKKEALEAVDNVKASSKNSSSSVNYNLNNRNNKSENKNKSNTCSEQKKILNEAKKDIYNKNSSISKSSRYESPTVGSNNIEITSNYMQEKIIVENISDKKSLENGLVFKSIDKPVINKLVEIKPVEKPLENKPVIKQVNKPVINKSVEIKPMEKPLENKPVIKQVNKPVINKAVEINPVEKPLENKQVIKQLDKPVINKAVEINPVEKPLENKPVIKPIQKPVINKAVNKPVEKPVINKPVNKVVNNTVNSPYVAEIEEMIFNKVNEERAKAGVAPLKYSNIMQKYGRIKSEDMGVRKYFSHEDPSGQLITVKMKADGLSYNAWGENIASVSGYSGKSNIANQFMTRWMNSPGHRKNILSPNFTSIGVGVYKTGDTYYATQEFMK